MMSDKHGPEHSEQKTYRFIYLWCIYPPLLYLRIYTGECWDYYGIINWKVYGSKQSLSNSKHYTLNSADV